MSESAGRLLVVLGNQLFPPQHVDALAPDRIFMAEDLGLCTYVRHHQQKIVLFLAAMRSYRDALVERGFDVHYVELDPDSGEIYEDKLAVAAEGAAELVHFEIEDKAMESRIIDFADTCDLDRIEIRSPMFLTSREGFRSYAKGRKQLRMADFYRNERIRQELLLEREGEPVGGRWSYDDENRRKLPKTLTPPSLCGASPGPHVAAVAELVADSFAEHPGNAADFWWPSTREQSLEWLERFVAERLELFGPYEDAMSTRSETVFHSALSPVLNLGLITPDEVVEAVVDAYESRDLPLNSVEGFVRQVIGWREFVRGVYRGHSDAEESENFFGHERGLTAAWYEGDTGIEPLDDTIRTAQRLGWTHHIPRLMVAGNLMTLCEIRPAAAHRWFMEMYVDSSEWVMGPNVYGMALFSDGGLFATKPYICGSNYLRKMSDYKAGPWCDVVDGLYWRFIDRHRKFFAGNPRLALMPRALDRLSKERLDGIFAAAEAFLEEYTS
ncbi:MAG: cryptochrome/photolyase family protein [Pseudomonadota bacterium]